MNDSQKKTPDKESTKKELNTKQLLKYSILSSVILLILLVLFLYIYTDLLSTELFNAANINKTEVTEDSDIITSNSHFRTIRSQLTNIKGNGRDIVTIMIYMNGSDLETLNGNASKDLSEMLQMSSSDNVNVIIQTMGTKEWHDYNIASDHSQRYLLKNNKLELIDDSLDQLSCGEQATLQDFLTFCKTNYPANRNILIFWNHGGGPVDGFGKDEWGRDTESLTIDEMAKAIKAADLTFDFIGMDCCLMSSLEVCYALYEYCDYMILSENFESSIGWYYSNWLNAIAENPSMDTYQIGKIIVDDIVSTNNEDPVNGGTATLAVIDERYIPNLYRAWKDYAYANENDLVHSNYSRVINKSSRARDFSSPNSKVTSMENYFVTDIMALASSLYSEESKPLISQLKKAIIYYDCTENCQGLTGMSITLPYNDRAYYYNLKKTFLECGFDKGYITWLYRFVTDANNATQYDFQEFDNSWEGWE